MKKLTFWIIAFAVLSRGGLLAQDISGTWQGTLHSGQDLRLMCKISKSESGGMKAVSVSRYDPRRPSCPMDKFLEDIVGVA